MAHLEIASEAPNVQHSISVDGKIFQLECDGGFWTLTEGSGEPIAQIGHRKSWTDALATALEHVRKVD